MILNKIGESYNCDKADNNHQFDGESYFDIYEKYFLKFKDKKINLLELGVRDSSSLNTWASYFTDASIHGVDIDHKCKLYQTSQFQIHIFSQDDKKSLESLSDLIGDWDIIIDDSSHINTLSIASFDILWNKVKSGGIYIIEDLGNSYNDLTEDAKSWDGMNYNSVSFKNNREDMNNLFFYLISLLDKRIGDVRSIHFHQQIAIIEKL